MFTSILALFLAAFVPGVIMTRVSQVKYERLKLVLVFSGAYLFSITIIHIFPELYTTPNGDPFLIGIFVLLGFFLQQILEYFTSGVEHGHIHQQDAHHSHGELTSVMVLGGLCIHAFLEGALLAHPSTIHAHHDSLALLGGIVIHKIPASVALMSVLLCDIPKKGTAIVLLLIFSVASPLGLVISELAATQGFLSSNAIVAIFGIVSGNFLYISTTIFYETSPNHRFNAIKVIVSILGVLVAIGAELIL